MVQIVQSFHVWPTSSSPFVLGPKCWICPKAHPKDSTASTASASGKAMQELSKLKKWQSVLQLLYLDRRFCVSKKKQGKHRWLHQDILVLPNVKKLGQIRMKHVGSTVGMCCISFCWRFCDVLGYEYRGCWLYDVIIKFQNLYSFSEIPNQHRWTYCKNLPVKDSGICNFINAKAEDTEHKK